jgi:hypothetical protein
MNRAPLGGGGSEELCIGSGRNRYTKSPSPPQDFQRSTAPMLSVYDSCVCIGFILRRGEAISLEQAQRRLLERRRGEAAASTVEALVYSLRRDLDALAEAESSCSPKLIAQAGA